MSPWEWAFKIFYILISKWYENIFLIQIVSKHSTKRRDGSSIMTHPINFCLLFDSRCFLSRQANIKALFWRGELIKTMLILGSL